ncbi:MAG: hypothetical protein GY810_14405 [Aureispira sp.]|nr:hypothetical protein [Aureispira sp.]
MAGIAGITAGTTQAAKAMLNQLRHRGITEQIHSTPQHTFLGDFQHIVDKVNQPSSGSFHNDQITVSIAGTVFIDDYRILTPTSIAEYFLRYGTDLFEDLSGPYVLAIHHQDKLYLVRDAVGEKTLFYALFDNKLAWAVEAKGIHAIPSFSPSLDVGSIFRYFTYSFCPMDNTMVKEIKELPAGFYLEYNYKTSQAQLKQHFELEAIAKSTNTDVNFWAPRVREQIEALVQKKLERKNEVGVFLSGGLDSSLIAGCVSQLHSKPIHTFSIHFGKKYGNELDYAKMVADRWKTEHHEVLVSPKKFIPSLRKTIWHLDDPVGDPITVPNFELARYAANYTDIIFNGEGGDPCFGGPKNIPMLMQDLYPIERPKNHKEKAYLDSYRRGYTHMKNFFSKDMLAQLDEEKHLEGLLTPFFQESRLNQIDQLMAINIRLKGAHLILPKVERMLGASQITPIAPLFSKQIVESSMQMPSNLKLHGGIEKYILKQAFANDIPQPIIDRPKSGMRVPVRYWFQGEMKRYARKLLNKKSLKQAGIFNPEAVSEILKYSKVKGFKRHGLLIWMMMTFEIWRKLFIEKEPL